MKRLMLVLIGFVVLSGCDRLVIEELTLLVSVPPNSNEVNLYYVYEGISFRSVRDRKDWSKSDLDQLRQAKFNFFAPSDGQSALEELCDFEDLRFFIDPTRKRQLCADRRMTIRNRSEFAKILNQAISEAIKDATKDRDEQAIKDLIESHQLERDRAKQEVNYILGPVPLFDLMCGVEEIFEKYDVGSIRRVIDAAEADFGWLRFEPNSIELVLPATVETARQIATESSSIEWLKAMRSKDFPIELLSRDDGLVISLGGTEDVISFVRTDKRPYSAAGEGKVIQLAGGPTAIIVNGKAESAEGLVKQFISEKAGFRRWNDATGKFSVMAKFGGIVDGKVVLIKDAGNKVFVAPQKLGIRDQVYLDEVKK